MVGLRVDLYDLFIRKPAQKIDKMTPRIYEGCGAILGAPVVVAKSAGREIVNIVTLQIGNCAEAALGHEIFNFLVYWHEAHLVKHGDYAIVPLLGGFNFANAFR